MEWLIVLVIIIVLVWFIGDKADKTTEINNDKELSRGLKFKYPLLYDHFINDLAFTLKEENRTTIKLAKVLHRIDVALHIEIVYQAGNRLQIIQQAYRLEPKKYMTTKSYFHSSLINENVLIEGINKDMEDFLEIILSRIV